MRPEREEHPAEVTAMFVQAALIREVEERFLRLFAEGKLHGTVHTCIGQEFSGVSVARCLRPGDLVFSNHRGHGHFLALTDDVEGLVAEVMGRATGVCGGRGGSQHLHKDGFYSNGIQGGMVPVAAGAALALKGRNAKNLAVVFIGDGTLGQGVLYESLNIMSLWKLPVLVVLENNRYAQSTPQDKNLAGDINARAEAFGFRVAAADTSDPGALLTCMRDAVEQVRTRCEPAFMRVDTNRLMAHSKGDDTRDPAEVKEYWSRDPLALHGPRIPGTAEVQVACRARVDQAVARADAAPFAVVEAGQSDSMRGVVIRWSALQSGNGERVAERIHAGLRSRLQEDSRVVLLGEDIEGPYGGAFKVTRNLSLEFPGRVRNTPISEAAILGVGSGLALQGLRPVCELMFGDFLMLAADQFINHAAKFGYMYYDRVTVPVVIRTPMGGRRGYGATHSQSLEKHVLGVPGTRVLAINHRLDPFWLYEELLRTIDRPTLVVENKVLYASRVDATAPTGFTWEQSDEAFATIRLRPLGCAPDVTLLCYGGMLPEAEVAVDRLFEDHDIVGEIVCPSCLYPWNPEPLLESLAVSRCLLAVEEGQGFCAFGSEAIAQVVEAGGGRLLRGIQRLNPPPHAIPSSGPAESRVLPGADAIVECVRQLVARSTGGHRSPEGGGPGGMNVP